MPEILFEGKVDKKGRNEKKQLTCNCKCLPRGGSTRLE